MGKKALVVVSFGTTYPAARQAIAQLEERLRDAFPDYDLFRAFTSGVVIRKIAREEGEQILTPEELLGSLAKAGYDEVLCQSLHVIFGQEFEKLLAQIAPLRSRFARFAVGRPLLWDTADYLRLVRALLAEMPRLNSDEAFIFMGHGTEHRANAAYALVENVFRYEGAERVYVATVEGFPHLDYVLGRLDKKQVTRVYVQPLMIVAGDHAQNDLAGDETDSWKSRLLHEGYEVDTRLCGLGELDAVGALFVDHCRAALTEQQN